MEKNFRSAENYSCYDYSFARTTVRYVVMRENKSVFLLLLPRGMEADMVDIFQTVKTLRNGYTDSIDWYPGSLVHLHLAHHFTPMYDNSLKLSETTKKLRFDHQEVEEEEGCQVIRTYVCAEEGYSVCHELTHYGEENGFEIRCIFRNHTGKAVTLEMITSASLDNLSPFMHDDGSRSLAYHFFKAGWALEGKHVRLTLPEMNMEKSWGGSFECDKIGTIGSKSVGRFHPYAALEDFEHGCTWGIKLKHNASWQIELSRYGTPLSLSAGIADMKYGAWRKEIPNHGSFQTPTAYVAVAAGGIAEVSNDLNRMNHRDIDAFGEEGMPIMFNDWGTHWGNTSEEKMLSIAALLENSKTKYITVDDGWFPGTAGDWTVDCEKFPQGLRAYADKLRSMGKVPGIWMEFEAVRVGSKRYGPEYDHLYLKKDGVPLINTVSNSVPSKILDFGNPEVQAYLEDAVIRQLKENHIGYIKVDSNINVGLGCDGPESYGENLRQQMLRVWEFFRKIKREIPDVIIENCASGGARLDPMMMGASAMSSFSDAIECFEVPIIAANLHYLICPRQNQVWCGLKEWYDRNRMMYVISSGFLGRICWTGFLDKLAQWQLDMMFQAEEFYEKVSPIIKHGDSFLYRTHPVNYRYPQGIQAVVRYSEDKQNALVVVHCFDDTRPFDIPIDGGYALEASLYEHSCCVSGNTLHLEGTDRTGNVFLLTRLTGKR